MSHSDIAEAIRSAARAGDMKRLNALSGQFPQEFSTVAQDDLLHEAHAAGQLNMVLHLILEHHCLMLPTDAAEIDRDLMGERRAQIHRTLEVFADAARGHISPHTDSEISGISCYDVASTARWAASCNMRDGALHPFVLQAAANGDMQRWIVSLREEEEQHGFTLGRHTGSMLTALEDNVYYLASYAPPLEKQGRNEEGNRR